jgi:ABC-type phosphate/phosphonate transport system ATPase subunit
MSFVLPKKRKISDQVKYNPTKPKMSNIEGNIGSGKTPLLEKLAHHISTGNGRDDIHIKFKPVEDWNSVKDRHGYQISDVNKTIKHLVTSTNGFIMGKRGLNEFYAEVLDLCEKEQQSFTFKRATITTDELLDEMEPSSSQPAL